MQKLSGHRIIELSNPFPCSFQLLAICFTVDSLRLLQHVETIQAPYSWNSMGSKSWEEVSWLEKHFEV